MKLDTIFVKNVVKAPAQPVGKSGLRVLKAGRNNEKLGARLIKGRWKGSPIYSLTLVERRTCWIGCNHWEDCYGDNMFLAKRHEPGPELEEAVAADCALLEKRSRRPFVVRLHVLGDFYSPEYVRFWQERLDQCSKLRVFGYTHWQYGHAIGDAVTDLVLQNRDRVSILRSDPVRVDDPLPGAYSLPVGATAPEPNSVVCPTQLHLTDTCGTCGLCMNGRTEVSFLNHGRKAIAARRQLPMVHM